MGRDFRFRISGIIFIIVLLLNLIVTDEGFSFISSIFNNEPDTLQIIITIMSGVFIFFATDSIGYIFNTFFQLIFNILGGYSGIFERGFGDLGKYFNEIYSKANKNAPDADEDFVKNIKTRLPRFNTEQILVYYFWHSENGATESLKQWVDRRFTAYFTSYSSIVAIVFATIISFSIIGQRTDLDFSNANWIVLGLSVYFCISCVITGEIAMNDAVRIVDMQVASFIEPRINKIKDGYKNEKAKKCPRISFNLRSTRDFHIHKK